MFLHYLVTFVYVIVCLVLLMVILLQQGKGGDIASAFGGSSSQTAFGARAGATLLTRITTVAAVLFMLGAIALGVMWQRSGGSSVVSGKARHQRAGQAGARAGEEAREAQVAGTGAGCPESPGLIRSRSCVSPSTRKWRNWQTHQLEGLAPARAWGFESPLPHHSTRPLTSPRPRSWRAFGSPGHLQPPHTKTASGRRQPIRTGSFAAGDMQANISE